MIHRTPIRMLRAVALMAAGAFAASVALAQGAYPTKPIQMAVSYAAGGGTDVVARVVATELAKQLGQSVVVENRVGAGGTLAVAHVAKSAPDGYNIGWFTGGPIVLAPITETSLPYNVAKDLIPVSQVQTTDQVLVARPGLKANTIPELVALAKKSPGSVSMGHTGIGTAQLLAAVMLERMAGIELNQIPYKGEAPMLNDIMGERVDMGLVTATSADPLVKSGKVKMLSSGGAKRAYLFPNTPSMAEAGYPNFDANSHMGIYVPAGTPPEIVNKLHAAVVAALRNPEVRTKLQEMGGTPVGTSPQEFAAFLKTDSERAQQMLKNTNVQAKQ
ncbi:MAG: tripartite tricarboxylate transporter substrate binding protein [Burkholderiales bacterium]